MTPDGIDTATHTMDIETVKARARLLTVKVLDELDIKASSMDVSSLVDTLNAAGKLSGAGNAQGSVNVNVGALHLAALKERSELVGTQRVRSRLLDTPTSLDSVDHPMTVDTGDRDTRGGG